MIAIRYLARYHYHLPNAQNNEICLLYPVQQNNPLTLKKDRGIWAEICADISITLDLPLESEL
jgi:hypothetical protein